MLLAECENYSNELLLSHLWNKKSTFEPLHSAVSLACFDSGLSIFCTLFACIVCLFSKMSLQALKLTSCALNLCSLDGVTQRIKEEESSDAQSESPSCVLKYTCGVAFIRRLWCLHTAPAAKVVSCLSGWLF